MTSLPRHCILLARPATPPVPCSKILRNIACQTLPSTGQERTDARAVPMDMYGTKIALIVGSMDLDMPPCPLAHRARVLSQGEGFCRRSTASLIPPYSGSVRGRE